jgi:hypothetical protein
MQEEQAKATLKRSIPIAVLVPLLTAGAYWIAFRYEAAYLEVFGFPPQSVQVSIESILAVFVLLSAAICLLIPFANMAALLWPKHPAIQEKVARLALFYSSPHGI